MGVLDSLTKIAKVAAPFVPVVGPIISGGLELIAGQQERSQANQQLDFNYAMQKEFAQNGISWKVADAKRAGIHPLAAIGASTAMPQAISIGGGSSGIRAVSRALKNMGQGVVDLPMRKIQMAQEVERLKNMKLENMKTIGELNKFGQGTDRAYGIVTPTNVTQKVDLKRAEEIDQQKLGIEGGWHGDDAIVINRHGFLDYLPGKKSEEAGEQDWFYQWRRFLEKAVEYGYGQVVNSSLPWKMNLIRSRLGKQWRSRMRRERPVMPKSNPNYVPGWRFRWDLHRGQWRYMAAGNGSFYAHNHPGLGEFKY